MLTIWYTKYYCRGQGFIRGGVFAWKPVCAGACTLIRWFQWWYQSTHWCALDTVFHICFSALSWTMGATMPLWLSFGSMDWIPRGLWGGSLPACWLMETASKARTFVYFGWWIRGTFGRVRPWGMNGQLAWASRVSCTWPSTAPLNCSLSRPRRRKTGRKYLKVIHIVRSPKIECSCFGFVAASNYAVAQWNEAVRQICTRCWTCRSSDRITFPWEVALATGRSEQRPEPTSTFCAASSFLDLT